MAKPPLLTQTAASLQALCASCGLKKTGTKAILVQRLRLAAKQFQPVPPTARILSIDLGLKNFAFSLLTPAPPPHPPRPAIPPTPPLPAPIHLHAWHRLDLSQPAPSPPPSPSPSPSPSSPAAITNEQVEDEYSPATLAALALALARTHLLPLRPTHVLIERQRFRTGGGSAIFEWTIRVNTLEAMLHAVFAALRGGGWSSGAGAGDGDGEGWEGRVRSVLPRRVAGFLFPAGMQGGGGGLEGEELGKRGRGANAGYLELKRGKVDMLARWLAEGQMVVAKTAQAKEMGRLFVEGWEEKGRKAAGGRGKTKGKEKDAGDGKVDKRPGRKAAGEIGSKMDDLSDAVLQGMVWLQWQRTLETLIRERPELLEED
ncbi:mitochondrial resolvase Ydc2 [Trichocladium antarcticum]|uniref:Mitochondrial resolvase Ydc2 n=1 Tax=Trichocladium antarcticum TaxID=1450529 RepID=A0AAN6UI58_9PEZI|nr:mitochondrial resolvase Ydc2 [Trichocladium antarcticum]